MTTLTYPPHPWSTGFQWRDHRGPFRALSGEQATQFDNAGFFTIPELLGRDEVAAVRREFDAYVEKANEWLQRQPDGRYDISEAGSITFVQNLVTKSDAARRLVLHPTLTGIATDLLGPNVNLYWDQAVYKAPEKPRRFPLHQDTAYKITDPEDFLSVWIALSDATVENGCVQVAPGVHRDGSLEHRYVDPLGWEWQPDQRPDLVPLEVKAGGAAVFSSLTPHLTGPNTTDDVRRAYLILYARAGTVAYLGEQVGPRPDPVPQDDPDFQFPVVVDGEVQDWRRSGPDAASPVVVNGRVVR